MNLNEDSHYHRRETRIDWLVGQIAKSAYSWKKTVAQVRRDADQVVKDLPCDFAEEQLAEMRDRYRNVGQDYANLAQGQALAKEQIAKEIEIETERLAKEAKAAKKAEKKAEKRRRREQAADELSVDLRKNLEYWQEKKHANEKKHSKAKTDAKKKPKGMEQWEWIDRIRHYEVNGVKLKTRTDHLTVKRILTQASMFSGTCVDADLLTEYDLTRVGGKKDGFTYSNLDREIRVRDGDKFIAVYHGKTPVAW